MGCVGRDDRCVVQKVTYVLIGSRSKLCNLIIPQALLVKYMINIDNLDYIQYNMWQSRRTVTELCSCYIIIITV